MKIDFIEMSKTRISIYTFAIFIILALAYYLFIYSEQIEPAATMQILKTDNNSSLKERNISDKNTSLEYNSTLHEVNNSTPQKQSITSAEIDAIFLNTQKSDSTPTAMPQFTMSKLDLKDQNTTPPTQHFEQIKIIGIVCNNNICKAELANNKTVKVGDKISVDGKSEPILIISERGIMLKNKFLAY